MKNSATKIEAGHYSYRGIEIIKGYANYSGEWTVLKNGNYSYPTLKEAKEAINTYYYRKEREASYDRAANILANIKEGEVVEFMHEEDKDIVLTIKKDKNGYTFETKNESETVKFAAELVGTLSLYVFTYPLIVEKKNITPVITNYFEPEVVDAGSCEIAITNNDLFLDLGVEVESSGRFNFNGDFVGDVTIRTNDNVKTWTGEHGICDYEDDFGFCIVKTF
jgi:predicted RNA-binding protein